MELNKLHDLIAEARTAVPLNQYLDSHRDVRYHALDEAALLQFVKLVREETIRECAAVCTDRAAAWAQNNRDGRSPLYDDKADAASDCAREIWGLLQ